MLFTQTITVPPGVQGRASATQDMELSYGIIRRVWLHFPPGCRGAVSVALFHRLQQIAPATPGEGVALDDVLFGFPMQYDLTSLPYTLQLRGWSPEASFSHSVTVYVDLDVTAAPTPAIASGSVLSLLQGLFAE